MGTGKLNDFCVTFNKSKEPIILPINPSTRPRQLQLATNYGEVEDLVHFPQYSATCFRSFRSIGIGSFGSRRFRQWALNWPIIVKRLRWMFDRLELNCYFNPMSTGRGDSIKNSSTRSLCIGGQCFPLILQGLIQLSKPIQ
ncbi:hypothetical protein RJ640_020392 [Escallonia rubra]|uniref:Uncharacterized protein n=1 Tax=Escallonia rubra TaxID=112253 RepID=A0AA88QQZ4_9ASTE|nr:hypothetical protein RJ640_020392 [Escallonia rubra]